MLGISVTLTETVFVYLCICIYGFPHQILGNIIFEVLVPSPFQKYSTCCAYVQLWLKLYLCICVFVYLYLGNESAAVGEWIVDVISFQKIFGLGGLECHIVEIWRDVTLVHTRTDGRTDGRNLKIELEFKKQNSQ